MGIFGIASLFLTFSMYFLLGYMLIKLILNLIKDTVKKNTYILLVTSIVISLFVSELILKYVTKSFLTYSERNGGFFYNSMYKSDLLQTFYRHYLLKGIDSQIFTNHPNTKRNIIKPEFTYTHSYNSLGIRNEEPIIDSNMYSIICLGDSFTEGVGSPFDSTWVKLLKVNLDESTTIPKLQMINAGINGSDPISEFILLEKRLWKYTPKMLIVSINGSDIDDIIVRGGFERYVNGSVYYSNGPWWEFFYSYSFIFRSIAHSFFDINYLLLTKIQYDNEKQIAIEKLENCINYHYKSLTHKNNIKLLVVMHPMQYELENGDFALQKLADSIKKNKSIIVVNLYEEYNKYLKRDEFKNIYWREDMHHNSEGYKLWADILTTKISPIIKMEN